QVAAIMLFFFSYARADKSAFLERFYTDLLEAVRSKAGSATLDTIGFKDVNSIEVGKPWPEVIAEALRSCRVFAYLHTPTFFGREGCGREFQVAKDRLPPGEATSPQPSCLQPILWEKTKTLRNVPNEISNIQSTNEACGEAYNNEGMLQLVRSGYGSKA